MDLRCGCCAVAQRSNSEAGKGLICLRDASQLAGEFVPKQVAMPATVPRAVMAQALLMAAPRALPVAVEIPLALESREV